MNNQQLKILIEHGEVWESNGAHKLLPGQTIYGFRLYPFEISYEFEIRKLLKAVEDHLKRYFSVIQLNNYEKWIRNNLERYSPILKDKERFICEEIIKLNSKLNILIENEFERPISFPVTHEDLLGDWFFYFKKVDMVELLTFLKFEIFEGGRITDVLNVDQSKKLHNWFFFNERLSFFDEAIEILKKIGYLKSILNDFESFLQKKKKTEEKYFTSFCPAMPIEFPTEYFSWFLRQKSKNGKPYLTQEELDNFIEKAFMGTKNIEKIRINFAWGEKAIIIDKFFQFWQLSKEKTYEKSKTRKKYISLLADNFQGFSNKVVADNFRGETVYANRK